MTDIEYQKLLKTFKRNEQLIHMLEKRVSIGNPLLQYLYRTTWHPDAIKSANEKFDKLLSEDMLANA